MSRVLVATDEPNYSLGLVEGYRHFGWSVITGVKPFMDMIGDFDVIHHQWPEEFVGWKAPLPEDVDSVVRRLEFWKGRAKSVFSVNNLYPHDAYGNAQYWALYSAFYRFADLITHFSVASKKLVELEYTDAVGKNHIIHSPPNYAVSLKRQTARGSCRRALGIPVDSFVILMLGRLRSWEEARLVKRAFEVARVPGKHLLIVGRLSLSKRMCGDFFRRLDWSRWLLWRSTTVEEKYVPEEELFRFIDSSDVMVVPRIGGLSSAIPLIAMTFGKMVVAPDCGAYPDYLYGSANLIYRTGDPESLARQLERAFVADCRRIGEENAAIAREWSWDRICMACLAALRRDESAEA
jgi:glycosyltransferase involved in cell wall biosynthesis